MNSSKDAKAIKPAVNYHDNYTAKQWMEAYHRACAKNPDVQPKFSWIVREMQRGK